jgi:hypothetical protein
LWVTWTSLRLAVIIDGSAQGDPAAADLHYHLVQMPDASWRPETAGA